MSLRASAATSHPMTQSSAKRLRKHRPCIRGCTAGSPHSSQPCWSNRVANTGELGPPCTTPVAGELTPPSAMPPARRHGPRRRPIRPALTRGRRTARSWVLSILSPSPRTSASTLRARLPSCTARVVRVVPHGGDDPAASHTSRRRNRARRSLPTASPRLFGPSWPRTGAVRSAAGARLPSRPRPALRGRPGSGRCADAQAAPAGSRRGVRRTPGRSPHRSRRHSPSSSGATPPADSPRRSGAPAACRRERDRGRPAPPSAGVWG